MSQVVLSGDTSGAITLAAPTIAGATTITLPATTGTMALTTGQIGMKNRIINGAMVVDQRNAGASVTNNASILVYPVDRFAIYGSVSSKFTGQQNAGSVTPPAGFVNYLGITSLSAYSVPAGEINNLIQNIEGLNTADLGWGTANAKTITLSFWVQSSLTGTFGGALRNSAGNRSYPFTYTISSANTWTQASVTIAGDTSGTWLTTNGTGIAVYFGLGNGSTFSGTAGSWSSNNYYGATGATSVVGTNGATFYITGVQLEVGSAATTFDFRAYGTELALCQRYYFRNKATAANKLLSCSGAAYSTTGGVIFAQFPVTLRAEPTALEQNGTAGDYRVLNSAGSAVNLSAVPVFNSATTINAVIDITVASGLTAGNSTVLLSTNSNAYIGWSAEL